MKRREFIAAIAKMYQSRSFAIIAAGIARLFVCALIGNAQKFRSSRSVLRTFRGLLN